jgi:hypothetical protein
LLIAGRPETLHRLRVADDAAERTRVAVRWYLRTDCHASTLKNASQDAASKSLASLCIGGYNISRPLLIDAARPVRNPVGNRWFVDETYVKIAGTTQSTATTNARNQNDTHRECRHTRPRVHAESAERTLRTRRRCEEPSSTNPNRLPEHQSGRQRRRFQQSRAHLPQQLSSLSCSALGFLPGFLQPPPS